MAKHLNAEKVSGDLTAELSSKASEIRCRYGSDMGWEQIQQVLLDPQITPLPCQISFDSRPLLPGEFAHATPNGESEGPGFVIYLHPQYATQLGRVSYLVLHQWVMACYAGRATVEDAEAFGALVLGLSKEAYFEALCELSGQIDEGYREVK